MPTFADADAEGLPKMHVTTQLVLGALPTAAGQERDGGGRRQRAEGKSIWITGQAREATRILGVYSTSFHRGLATPNSYPYISSLIIDHLSLSLYLSISLSELGLD